jgi:hypothetical protein
MGSAEAVSTGITTTDDDDTLSTGMNRAPL